MIPSVEGFYKPTCSGFYVGCTLWLILADFELKFYRRIRIS